MELIYTDSAFVPQGLLRSFDLDIAYGDSENDFELTVEADMDIEPGALVYQYGTELGGIVDSKEFDSTGDVPVIRYTGRTWHGMMDTSITRPNAGAAYLTLTGDINEAIGTLLSRSSLGGVLAPSGSVAGVAVSYQVPRYVSVWDAVRRMCRAYGMRPRIVREDGRMVVDAVPRAVHSGGDVSDAYMPLSFTRNYRPTNHLVLLGKGELADRLVYDVYADADGNVSRWQSLFGTDERTEVYETSSTDDLSKLIADGLDKLKGKQKLAKADMSLDGSVEYHVGDIVTALSVETGMAATAEVVKVVVRVDGDGEVTTDYGIGEPSIKIYN